MESDIDYKVEQNKSGMTVHSYDLSNFGII